MCYSFADLQYIQDDFDDGKACASVGQGSLMALYDTMFSQVREKTLIGIALQYFLLVFFCHLYANIDWFLSQLDVTSSQLLVTDGVFMHEAFRRQLSDTVNSLLSLRVIPIFNENDAVSTRREPLMVCKSFEDLNLL